LHERELHAGARLAGILLERGRERAQDRGIDAVGLCRGCRCRTDPVERRVEPLEKVTDVVAFPPRWWPCAA
jgi:hypothetical protein